MGFRCKRKYVRFESERDLQRKASGMDEDTDLKSAGRKAQGFDSLAFLQRSSMSRAMSLNPDWLREHVSKSCS
jgi:hypothetical protein